MQLGVAGAGPVSSELFLAACDRSKCTATSCCTTSAQGHAAFELKIHTVHNHMQGLRWMQRQ
jgi:hypothetical protein